MLKLFCVPTQFEKMAFFDGKVILKYYLCTYTLLYILRSELS